MPRLRLVKGGESPAGSAEPLDDARLVAAVRGGNSAMAGPFYDRTRPVVARAVHRLLGAFDNDFDDLVQVAMIDFLATARATEAQTQFETLARNPATNSTVRAAATSGLARIM